MSADDDKPPEARPTSATVHLRSHPPRGHLGTARAILTQLGDRVVRRLTEGSPPKPRREPEPRRTVDLPVVRLQPAESDEELALAGLRELLAQSDPESDEDGDKALYWAGVRELEACGAGEVVMRGSPADLRQRRAIPPSFAASEERRALWARLSDRFNNAASDADEPDEVTAWPGWPALQAKLHQQFMRTGDFAEPVFKAPSPPAPPTLLEGGLIVGESYFVEEDGGLARIPKNYDDVRDGDHVPPSYEVQASHKAKKAPKAGSVAAPTTSPEERHTRAVLTLVGQDGGGVEKKPPPDPIDELSEAECREALKAVREAVYGVAVDDVRLSAWGATTTAQTTVWLLDAPLFVQRSMDVHDALSQFGLDVHEENGPLVEYAAAAGVLLVEAGDLDWTDVPGAAAADGGGEE